MLEGEVRDDARVMLPAPRAGGYIMNERVLLQACSSPPTCAEKQKDLHGEELVVGQLQSHKLLAHLPHAQAQVVHGRLLHAVPEERTEGGGREGNTTTKAFESLFQNSCISSY